MEEKKFTLLAVLYAATGAVPIVDPISETYRKRAVDEIKNDSVCSYILEEIPESDRFYSDLYPDYDPIVRHYLCANYPEIKKLVSKFQKTGFGDYILDCSEYVTLSRINPSDYAVFAAGFENKIKRINNKTRAEKMKVYKRDKSRFARESKNFCD